MQKPISAADRPGFRVVIVTLDNHLSGAVNRARRTLTAEMPRMALAFHAASEWENDADALARCKRDIAEGDIIVVTMLFMEDHVKAVLPDLLARRNACDVMIGCMSAPEIVKLTRVGRFNMDGTQRSPLDFLKKLRGGGKGKPPSVGAKQMAMLRRIRASCASSRARPRTCAPISSPSNISWRGRTTTSATSFAS